jgi:hypothetical protein
VKSNLPAFNTRMEDMAIFLSFGLEWFLVDA